jgi:hypothetical protein
MKNLANVFTIVGLILLVGAGVGRLVGKPHVFMGVQIISVILLANTALLFAVLAKLSEKK